MSDEIKRIDIAEFRLFGFLQEVNRQFFHPLGLALEVVVEEDGSESLGGVWDSRDDPEGFLYGDGEVDWQKMASVHAEAERHRIPREALLGEGQTIQGWQKESPPPPPAPTPGLGRPETKGGRG